MVAVAYDGWSLTTAGRLQEVQNIVTQLGNFWYFRKLVAEEKWSQPEVPLYSAKISGFNAHSKAAINKRGVLCKVNSGRAFETKANILIKHITKQYSSKPLIKYFEN